MNSAGFGDSGDLAGPGRTWQDLVALVGAGQGKTVGPVDAEEMGTFTK